VTRRIAPFAAASLLLAGCSSVPLLSRGGDRPADVPSAAEAPAEIARLELKAAEQPAEPYWPFRIGEIRAAGGATAEAEASLRAALARDPDHAPSLSLLSRLWYDAGRHDEAVDLLETARARTPLPEALDVALALHYDALGEVDAAEELANGVDADWATDGAALTYLHLRGDDFLASEEIARKALDASPSAVNHNNYGIARLYGGDPEAAREHFVKAADLDPALPGPLYNLAIVDRFYRFDVDGARRWFARYRELSDEDPDNLAEALALEIAGSAPDHGGSQ
jgi:tetratricopeptide (TPR) repeat protein